MVFLLEEAWEIGPAVTSLSPRRKLRPLEVMSLAKAHTAGSGCKGTKVVQPVLAHSVSSCCFSRGPQQTACGLSVRLALWSSWRRYLALFWGSFGLQAGRALYLF